MNGRYFAGKQITCEFVGVTRWKVAICGEYMRSRLKTCSHGTACNFIHCFRNPGGDYEWADWDNPPPKYWIRKMAVLFGHSDESSYGKQMELDDFESPRDSRRKGTPIIMKFHDRKRERRTNDSRRDRPERRERSLRHKSEQSEEHHESKVLGHDTKNYPHRHDSSEDRSKRRRREMRQRHEADQKSKSNQRTEEELSAWQPRESSYDKQEKSERKHKRSKRSTSCSSEEYYISRRAIDVQDRHDEDFSNQKGSGHDDQGVEKIDRYKARNHAVEHKSNDRSTTDEFSDRWESTLNTSDKEETRDHSCNGSSSSYRKARRSDGKCKHRRRKREHETDSLCSDEESDRWELKYSRSRNPT